MPEILLSSHLVREAGRSAPLAVDPGMGQLELELRISRTIEKQSLEVSILGSKDGERWEAKPLYRFPTKCYCGRSTAEIDLSEHPQIRYIRASWVVSRWSQSAGKPLFEVSLEAQQESAAPANAAGVLAATL